LWDKQVKLIHDAAASVSGCKPEIHIPPIANHVPSLHIRWDQTKIKATPDEVRKKLREGHPSIETVGDESSVDITTWMMIPGEERIVAQRVKDILQSATG
jgi:L-seryl-tRNA(Ser) seleniumtransferase